MNKFMSGLKSATNYARTENGAVVHKSTLNDLLDMFAFGGAYRSRSDADVITLFSNAFNENEAYALKCLFYLRDVRGGQGERRFFRVCMKWLAKNHPEAARRNLEHIPEYGRWDDLYVFVDTPLENDALHFMKKQLALDVQCKTPSLLAKWLKSENASSRETRRLAIKTRQYFGMTAKQYRKTLSVLRSRINVLEKLMSEGRWDEIEFDKIPSRAGMIYRNAFARHDIERMRADKELQSYADFARDDSKSVNAKTLYPYECVGEVLKHREWVWGSGIQVNVNETERLMLNKYWANLADYINGASFNGIAVVDTSGSMCGSGVGAPINVALSLGLYCAEKAKGPYADHFITFSERPSLVRVEGVDFCDKVNRMMNADWGMNTNIEAVFDMLLNVAINNHCSQDEIPQNLIIISDMEFDSCITNNKSRRVGKSENTLFDNIAAHWAMFGYKLPHVIFWNVNARHNNIPMLGNGPVSFVSGFSPAIFDAILSGKTGEDMMLEKLDSERYAVIK